MKKRDKLRTYVKLKDRLVLEPYVVELDRDKSRELTMLRGGSNRLRIETGRWKRESRREKVEERVCKVCLCGEIEDGKPFFDKM